MSNVLPPKDELLAEFDSGQIPRSKTWHTLITGLYLNFEQVSEIKNWYEQIQDLNEHNQNLANIIKTQYDQIEIWYGDVDRWQQQVSQNTQLTEQYKTEAHNSKLAAAESEPGQKQAKATPTPARLPQLPLPRHQPPAPAPAKALLMLPKIRPIAPRALLINLAMLTMPLP